MATYPDTYHNHRSYRISPTGNQFREAAPTIGAIGLNMLITATGHEPNKGKALQNNEALSPFC
jgi:hypothetical protein